MKKNNDFLKRILYITAFSILMWVFIPGQAFSYEFYNWEHGPVGYELAVMDAKEDNEPLILYIYSASDELSQKMNNDYLASYEVEVFLIDIPKVEIDTDNGAQEKELAARYEVNRYPAFFVSIPSFGGRPQKIFPFLQDRNLTTNEFMKEIKGVIAYQYNEKAFQSYEKMEYEEAIHFFNLALNYDPGKAYTYYAIGTVYHTIGFEKNDPDYIKMAEENYLKALKIDPNHKETEEELKKLREDKEKFGIK